VSVVSVSPEISATTRDRPLPLNAIAWCVNVAYDSPFRIVE